MVSNLESELSEALKLSERRRCDTQRLSGVGFWELNHKDVTLYWSEEIYAIYELDPEELEPSYETFLSLIHKDDKEFVDNAYRLSVESGKEYNIRYRIKTGEGSKWIEARGVTYYDNDRRPERSIGTAQDISEITRAQQVIEHLAMHDALTGLPNRTLFSDRFKIAMSLVERQKHSLAVLFIDLDNFKKINDKHGHDIGDEVLIGVAKKLEISARSHDTFARIGGDEFAGLIAIKHEHDINLTIQRIKDAIEGSYETKEGCFPVTACIGITMFPEDNEEPDALLRHADNAMYRAKETGSSSICFFDREKHQFNISKHQLVHDIQKALVDSEFQLYFQPKVSLHDGTLVGAEALLRWFRPDGPFSPAEIVAAVSGTSLEWELDMWVAKEVMTEIKRIEYAEITVPISINFSPGTIQKPELPSLLAELLAAEGVSGEKLEIEILEVGTIERFDYASAILQQCKALGLSVSLDDFGTGFASLTSFHTLPIDKLKIDQHFIKSLLTKKNSLTLVKSILALTKENNKPVIAEGVESLDIASILLELGCDIAQGYAIARPMPRVDFIEWAKQWKPKAFMTQVKK